MDEEVAKKIEELTKMIQDEINARKQLARAVIKLSEKLEEHVKGGMSIEELQACLQKVQELVSTLQSAGINLGGEGNNWLTALLAYNRLMQQQAGETEVKQIDSKKSKKIKKILEEAEEDESESEEEE